VLTPDTTAALVYSMLSTSSASGSRPRRSSISRSASRAVALPREHLSAARLHFGAIRQIPFEIRPFESLGLPSAVKDFCTARRVSCSSAARREAVSRRRSPRWST
jgi:hypothetical protein